MALRALYVVKAVKNEKKVLEVIFVIIESFRKAWHLFFNNYETLSPEIKALI